MSEQLHYDVRIDIANLKKDVEQVRRQFADLAQSAQTESKKMDASFSNVGKAVATYFSVQQIANFAKAIVDVRGQIEMFEISFNTLVGSKDKAKAFFNEIKDFAVKTPLSLQQVSKSAQTLLGFGVAVDDVMPIIKQLGDISMGNAQSFASLTLAFAQATSAGKLMGQDLLQMVNAGFNPLQELTKLTGKSMGELRDEMSKGQISAQMLRDALASASGVGGQFHGMLEKQSKGIVGSISNLQGAWEEMLNKIGTEQQGIITSTIGMAQTIVENYEPIIKTIAQLISIYGAYKVALWSVMAVQKLQALSTLVKEWWWAMGRALGFATANQIAFNNASKANIYIAIATAIMSVVSALVIWGGEQSEVTKKIDENNKAIDANKTSLDELAKKEKAVVAVSKNVGEEIKEEVNKVDELSKAVKDTTLSLDARKKALEELRSIVPQYNGELSAEGVLYKDNAQAIDDYIQKLKDLAMAKALQAKREEYTGTLIENEMKSRQQKKELDKRLKEQQEAQKNYNSVKQASNNASHFAPSWAVNSASIAEYRDALNLANSNVDKVKSEMAVANAYLEDAKANIAEIDAMQKELNVALPKGKPTTPKTTTKSAKATSKTQEKEDAEKQAKERARHLVDLEFEVEQSRIDAMAEGSVRTLEQMKLNHKKELEELKREREDNATAEDAHIYDTIEGNIRAKQKAENDKFYQDIFANMAKVWQEYSIQYGSFAQRVATIRAKYSKLITDEQSKPFGIQDSNQIATWQAEMEQAIAEIELKAKGSTSNISKLFGDMSDLSIKELRDLQQKGSKLLEFVEGGKWDNEKGALFGISKETFNVLTQAENLDDLRKIIKGLTEQTDEAEPIFKKLGKAIEDLFDGNGDLPEDLENLFEEIQKITSAVNFLSDSFGSLADAFGGGALSTIASGLGLVANTMSSAMDGTKIGSAFGGVGAIVGGAIGGITSLITSISKLFDSGHEKKIEELQDVIDDLDRSYNKLLKTAEETYSMTASANYEQANANLQRQSALIIEQMNEEREKKNVDEDRLKQWENELAEIQDQIEENKQSALDAIMGEDMQSAIDNFADAVTDMWATNSSSAKTSKEVAVEMIRKMVNESIKEMIQAEGKIEALREKMRGFMIDGVLSADEREAIYNDAESIIKDATSKYAWAEGLFNEDSSQSGSARGFQAMSQDTAEELNGRFTALVELQQQQLLDSSAIRTSMNEMRNLSMLSLSHLEDIAKSNNELYQINERLNKIEQNTRNL